MPTQSREEFLSVHTGHGPIETIKNVPIGTIGSGLPTASIEDYTLCVACRHAWREPSKAQEGTVMKTTTPRLTSTCPDCGHVFLSHYALNPPCPRCGRVFAQEARSCTR